MAIHRWRAVVDYYDYEATEAEPVEDRAEMIREQFTKWFPCGVLEFFRRIHDLPTSLSSAAGSDDQSTERKA